MTIRIRTSAAVTLTATGDWAATPTHAVLWIGATLLDSAEINPALAQAPADEDSLTIVDEGAPFDLVLTGASESALNAIISAGLDEIDATLSLHTGAPGADGDQNEVAVADNPGYERLELSLESLVV